MRKLFVLLSSLGLVLGLFGISVSPVAAACSNFKVTWYEDPNYGGGAHTFAPYQCSGTSNFDMTEYVTGDGHACSRGFPVFPASLLNDCASSWKIVASCHMHVTLYTTTTPSGVMDGVSAPLNRANLPGGWGDALSYIRFSWTSQCISGPSD